MRLSISGFAIALVTILSCVHFANAQGPMPPQPIYWRQNLFAIPFRVAPSPDGAGAPVEVQLRVSVDQGVSWQRAAPVDSQAGQFSYRAPRDGEYWFVVQSIGVSSPIRVNVANPQLRVVVDTVAPQLEFEARREPNGAVTAEWQIRDQHLDPRSFVLEFRAAEGSREWQTVAVQPSHKRQQQTVYEGHAHWYPQQTMSAIQIRARVHDLAGNPAWSQAVVPVGGEQTGRETAAFVRPGSKATADGTRRRPDHDFSRRRWPPDAVTDDPLPRDPDVASTAQRQRFSDRPRPRDTSRVPVRRPRRREQLLEPYRVKDGKRPDRTAELLIQQAEQRPPQPSPINPLVGDVYRPPAGEASAATDRHTTSRPTSSDLPEDARPRKINSTQFELEYEIGSVEPSRVELWGTTDGGRRWRHYGRDADGQSPMIVEVEGDGLYGFRLFISALDSEPSNAPAEGEQPELWVAVERTPPVARFAAIEQGTGRSAGELTIDWMATDESALSGQPISLSYSDSPRGPWFSIVEGLTNTKSATGAGRFVWLPSSRVTGSIYLRLQVRDEAGNVTTVVSEPIVLNSPKNDSRIRDVRPLNSRD